MNLVPTEMTLVPPEVTLVPTEMTLVPHVKLGASVPAKARVIFSQCDTHQFSSFICCGGFGLGGHNISQAPHEPP